jgi:L-aspartate oxidase
METLKLHLPRDFRCPRHLVPFSTARLPKREVDVLVMGSGLSGVRAALEARTYVPRVLVLTKSRISESSSFYAQGGIAAAVSEEDSIEAHVRDTLRVGCELNRERVVRIVIAEGVECVRELLEWGVQFDRERKRLSLAREGGHGQARVLHRGDETGMVVSSSLINRAQARGIEFLENTVVIDLLTRGGVCLGALCQDERGRRVAIFAKRTILATGGTGQVYRETTNPPVATGDGMACAFRAGARLVDMEFMQFHPTVLYVAGAPRVLISEAVRGAGAVLRDRQGRAFMKEYHRMGDLAPRDVVSRAILAHMVKTADTQAYLDVRSLVGGDLARRFPSLHSLCESLGLKPETDFLPVRPAAHYTVGGVQTDEFGRTSIRNLYAVGECAGSMFHGANRLASNSLLECLVFGRRAGRRAGEEARKASSAAASIRYDGRLEKFRDIDLSDMSNSLKSLMWRNVGVERDARGLREAIQKILFWSRYVSDNHFESPAAWELQNMMTAALAVAVSAEARRESRGVHFRTDCPKPRPEWRRHIAVLPR